MQRNKSLIFQGDLINFKSLFSAKSSVTSTPEPGAIQDIDMFNN